MKNIKKLLLGALLIGLVTSSVYGKVSINFGVFAPEREVCRQTTVYRDSYCSPVRETVVEEYPGGRIWYERDRPVCRETTTRRSYSNGRTYTTRTERYPSRCYVDRYEERYCEPVMDSFLGFSFN